MISFEFKNKKYSYVCGFLCRTFLDEFKNAWPYCNGRDCRSVRQNTTVSVIDEHGTSVHIGIHPSGLRVRNMKVSIKTMMNAILVAGGKR
jgi:hypothetical protein